MGRACVQVGSLALMALSVACASHRPLRTRVEAAEDSLETSISKVRRLSIAAAPRPRMSAGTLEDLDPELRDALAALAAGRTPAAHRRVADAYRRLRILDAAYTQYANAIAFDRRDGAAYEGLARIWRDWNTPELAVGDARRAIYYAPTSASAYTTFGTVMYALGHHADARHAFELASALEPRAAYAWTNLCYVSFQAGHVEEALTRCRHAIALDPSSAAAHNNLGLAYAAAGDLASAEREFSASGNAGARQFNLGIVLAAGGSYAAAAEAFERAEALSPGWVAATARARQARRNDQPRDGGLPQGTERR
jgi:tetratricopeptide (TPR) repeat protein